MSAFIECNQPPKAIDIAKCESEGFYSLSKWLRWWENDHYYSIYHSTYCIDMEIESQDKEIDAFYGQNYYVLVKDLQCYLPICTCLI